MVMAVWGWVVVAMSWVKERKGKGGMGSEFKGEMDVEIRGRGERKDERKDEEKDDEKDEEEDKEKDEDLMDLETSYVWM